MIVSLDSLYHSEFSLLPVRSGKGDLEFADIIVSLASAHGDVRVPIKLVLLRMSDNEQCHLFVEKLELIETCQHFFIQWKVSTRVNLVPAAANILLSDAELTSQIERFSFLELITNENYPESSKGKDDPILAALTAQFPLVLTSYGSGGISTRVISDGLFKRVVPDKGSAQQRIVHISFEPFTRAILA